MNNQQFRKQMLDTPARQDGANGSPRASGTPSSLGSKKSSFVPMTPRTVGRGVGVDFARQVAERNAAGQPAKKFKASAAPKGVKLGSGYRDRTLDRLQQEEQDDKAARIEALEEQMKLGQLDVQTFESLRDQIAGGEIESTHLIKGLDRKLLERVRRGEDVLGTSETTDELLPDVDEELDKLEEQEVAVKERESVKKKKGEMAPPPLVAGTKRSRDAILAELKEQRKAAAAARLAARPELGDKFKSVEKPQAGSRLERDDKGREVLITVDEDGRVKKKVRKVQGTAPATNGAMSAEKAVRFLDEGVTVPQLKQVAPVPEVEQEDSDGDIFEDAGTSYNPLGDDEDEDDDSDEENNSLSAAKSAVTPADEHSSDEEEGVASEPSEPSASPSAAAAAIQDPSPSAASTTTTMPPPPIPAPAVKRNYFKSAPVSDTTDDQAPHNPLNDPAFLAAIKKAGSLANFKMQLSSDASAPPGDDESDADKDARLRKRATMLAASDRDLEDMDLGFGSSRFGDEEEEGGEGAEGRKVKLSEWRGAGGGDDGDGDDGGKGGGGGGKKKRSRRRKGDKDSAKDVLGVLERRQQGGKA